MKAIIHTKYGDPASLQLHEVAMPTPKDNEVLVKVHAAAINDWDGAIVQGRDFITRLGNGFIRPRTKILGCDVAGVVELIGKQVKSFKPGDAVYGDLHGCGFGAFAEYVCATENALVLKPDNLSFEKAAALPHGAALAWQGLMDDNRLKSARTLLINGAGGGAGTIALQLAKIHGLEVTGVDSADKLPLLTELGCDHVIDYQSQDFTRLGKSYDLIFDVKTLRSPFAYLPALNPNGCYVTVGGPLFRLIQVLLFSGRITKRHQKLVTLVGLEACKGLPEMAELFASGKVKPVIDGPFPLEELPQVMARYLSGKPYGRVVISTAGANTNS